MAVKPSNKQLFAKRLRRAWDQHQAGQLAAVGKVYRELLAEAPDNPDLNNLAGLLQLQTGQPGLAEKLIRRALLVEPDNPQSHYNLGMAYKDQHKWKEAAAAFQTCVDLAPDNAQAMNSLGNALRLGGQPEESLDWLERSLALQPGHPAVLLNLGMLHNQLGRRREAESYLTQVVAVQPRNAEAWNDLGVAHSKQGKPYKALQAYREATQASPDFSRAWLNRGRLEEQLGQLDLAAKSLKKAIASDPALIDAHFHLAHLRSHHSTPKEIDDLETLWSQGDLDDTQTSRLAYALGFAHESNGDYDRAFNYMNEAHGLLGKRHRFNLESHREAVLDNIAICTPENLSARTDTKSSNKRPVLICGMPRSGTTLVEQILASHPQVFAAGEQVILARLAGDLAAETGIHYPACLLDASQEWLSDAALQYEETVLAPSGNSQRVTDTTPMNYLYLGLVAKMNPHARIVLCVRDPMDNCLSIYRQQLTGPHAYAHDLETLGQFYALHTQLARHWQKTLHPRLLVIRYEELVNSQEKVTRGLLDHCDLPFDSACLAFHETDRLVRSPSASQVRQPLYSSAVGAWRKYEQHLGPLKTALGLRDK
jgi:tetratricopeptide (TPR) repeat protein